MGSPCLEQTQITDDSSVQVREPISASDIRRSFLFVLFSVDEDALSQHAVKCTALKRMFWSHRSKWAQCDLGHYPELLRT